MDVGKTAGRALLMLVGVTVCVAILVVATFLFGAPDVKAEGGLGGSIVLSNVFLGEYSLGFVRGEIWQGDVALFIFDCGDSSISTVKLSRSHVALTPSGDSCAVDDSSWTALDVEQPVRMKLCGNNGSGRVRCSSQSVAL